MSLLAFMESVDILPRVAVQELTILFSPLGLNSIIFNVNIHAIVDSQRSIEVPHNYSSGSDEGWQEIKKSRENYPKYRGYWYATLPLAQHQDK